MEWITLLIPAYLANHGSKTRAERTEFSERFLEDSGEGEKAQGVACWCRVKHNNGVFHRLDVSAICVIKLIKVMCQKTHFIISAKLIASSTPGMANARSCIIEPIIPLESAGIRNVRQSRM